MFGLIKEYIDDYLRFWVLLRAFVFEVRDPLLRVDRWTVFLAVFAFLSVVCSDFDRCAQLGPASGSTRATASIVTIETCVRLVMVLAPAGWGTTSMVSYSPSP